MLGSDLVPLRWPAHDLRQHHAVAAVFERSDRGDLLALLVADAGQGKLVLRAVPGQMRPVQGDLVALLADYILRERKRWQMTNNKIATEQQKQAAGGVKRGGGRGG